MEIPKSHEILKDTINKVGAKSVAKDLRLSPSLIYKWCEPCSGDEASGSENPLDRVLALVKATKDPAPVNWLCQHLGGFYVPNTPDQKACREPILVATQRLLQEFTDVLQAVSLSLSNDSRIDEQEAVHIRQEWEILKSHAEAFVLGCEQGAFR